MKLKSLSTLPELPANHRSAAAFAIGLAALLGPGSVPATTLYWDSNGTAANTAGSASGAWNGANAYWNTDLTGGAGGTVTAATDASDDLILSSGSLYTAGTIAATGTRVASSLNFEDNIALTLSGAITIGGTGAKQGIFVLPGNNANTTVSGAQTLASAATIQTAGTGVLSLTGGITGAFDLTLQNHSTTAAGITIATGSLNPGGTVTHSGTGTGGSVISAVIGANVTGIVQNSATSALTLSGLNSAFAGGVSILTGTVNQSSGASALGTGTLKLGDLSGTSSATLNATGSGFTATNPITVQAGSSDNTLAITANNGSSFVYSGAVTLNHTLTLADTGSGSLKLSGIISDGVASNALVIGSNNTGTVRLDGVNAFDGGITVKAGTLQLTVAAAAGTGTVLLGDTLGTAAATLTSTATSSLTYPNPITVQAGSSGVKSITLASTSSPIFSGTVTLHAGLTIGSAHTGALTMGLGGIDLNANTLTITNTSTGRVFTDGVISGSGGVVMNTATTGDYVPRADHTYSGGTTLTAGFVMVDRDSSGPAGSPTAGAFGTGTVTLAGAQLRSGVSAARSIGNALVIASDTSFNSVANEKSLIFSGPATLSGGTRTLTSAVGTTVAGTGVFINGPIGDGGNHLGLTKAGAGNLTLAGINTYTGATLVSAGTLLINGTLGATEVTVSNGATLGGGGTLGGNVTVHGQLAPGNSPGTLTLANANLTIGTGGSVLFELGGTTRGNTAASYDSILGINTLQLDGSWSVSLINGFSPALNDAFDLFDAASVNPIGFDVGTDLQLPVLASGLSWDTTHFTTSGQLAIIPEPSPPTLVVAAVIAACFARRRSERVTRPA